jgi:hypothetical protein
MLKMKQASDTLPLGNAGIAVEPVVVLALVVTVTVKRLAAPLLTATLAGAVHVALGGAPLHAKVTVPLKPVPGITCKLNCAVWPAVTEAVVEPVPGVTPISAATPPVPSRFIDCGEFAASSVIVNVPLRTPGPVGPNVSDTTQFAFAST